MSSFTEKPQYLNGRIMELLFDLYTADGRTRHIGYNRLAGMNFNPYKNCSDEELETMLKKQVPDHSTTQLSALIDLVRHGMDYIRFLGYLRKKADYVSEFRFGIVEDAVTTGSPWIAEQVAKCALKADIETWGLGTIGLARCIGPLFKTLNPNSTILNKQNAQKFFEKLDECDQDVLHQELVNHGCLHENQNPELIVQWPELSSRVWYVMPPDQFHTWGRNLRKKKANPGELNFVAKSGLAVLNKYENQMAA